MKNKFLCIDKQLCWIAKKLDKFCKTFTNCSYTLCQDKMYVDIIEIKLVIRFNEYKTVNYKMVLMLLGPYKHDLKALLKIIRKEIKQKKENKK